MSDPRFSEADPNFDRSMLSESARRTLEAAERASQSEFASDAQSPARILEPDGIKAGYKIEIMFGPKRTLPGPNKCVISIYESGKRLHGGGDDLMYWCMKTGKEQNNGGCGMPIPSAAIQLGLALCPSCQSLINAEKLTGQQYHNESTDSLASHLEKIFHTLKDNADVYVKFDYTDVRYRACEVEFGPEEARRLRGLLIYPLKNILLDTANGSNLHARFKALLSA